jgi:hypothetical protein
VTTPRTAWWGADRDLNTASALKQADAEWFVRSFPLKTEVEDEEILVPGVEALVRMDHKAILNVVGETYPTFQNVMFYDWVSDLQKAADGTLVSAWNFGGGQVVGGTLSVFEDIPGLYVHALNHHGGGARELRPTLVRQGVSITLKGSTIYVRYQDTDALIEEAKARLRSTAEAVAKLSKQPATSEDVRALYEKLWRKPDGSKVKALTRWVNRRKEILNVWEQSQMTSKLDVYMAFATWAQWERSFRGSGGNPTINDSLRGEETLFGQTRSISEEALRHLRTPTRSTT